MAKEAISAVTIIQQWENEYLEAHPDKIPLSYSAHDILWWMAEREAARNEAGNALQGILNMFPNQD